MRTQRTKDEIYFVKGPDKCSVCRSPDDTDVKKNAVPRSLLFRNKIMK